MAVEDSTAAMSAAECEERGGGRRRAFAHFDVQSLTANVGYAGRLRGLQLLSRRRNTTTGASAASMLARASTPDSGDEETGDGRGNDLLDRSVSVVSYKEIVVFKKL